MTSFAKKAYERALDVNADLYHLHDPELLPFALKLKKHGKAVVFDSHENYVEQIRNKPYLPGKVAAFASKLYDQYSKRVFAKIDGLTYAGNGETATIFDNMCLRVVPTDNYPWLSELYDKYDDTVEKEKGTACYVGGLDEVRGITQIIKACYYFSKRRISTNDSNYHHHNPYYIPDNNLFNKLHHIVWIKKNISPKNPHEKQGSNAIDSCPPLKKQRHNTI